MRHAALNSLLSRATLAISFIAALAGCDGQGMPSSDDGALELAASPVPADVSCLEVIVSGGSRQVIRRLPAVPGSVVEARLDGLPTGLVSVRLLAFPASCSSLTPSSEATWVSDALTITLVRGRPVDLRVTMRENGRINLNVGFDFDVSPDAGTAPPALALCEHVSNRLGQRYYCVNEVAGATYSWISVLDGVVTQLASTTRCSPRGIILAGTTLEVVATVAGVPSAPLAIPFGVLPPMPLDPLCGGAAAPPTPLAIVETRSTSPTTVVLTFNRPVDPTSVQANGSQFSVNGGLVITFASVSGSQVTLGTSAQVTGAPYLVTIGSTITDTAGVAFEGPSGAFFGF